MTNKKITLALVAVSLLYQQSLAQSPGYYKDVFVDGGVHLTGMIDFPAAEDLSLGIEYLSTDAEGTQSAAMIANDNDSNGHLLYPDGEPRFRMIYTNGGSSASHGYSLGEIGRDRVRSFYHNGGSFMGSCAGAYISSIHCDSTGINEAYYGIWPGRTGSTGLIGSYTGQDIPVNSPLLNYFDFGNDNFIEGVRHNGGCWANEEIDFPKKRTEILLRYNIPERASMHGKASTWAYKPDDQTGRIVVIGSHPEFEQTGEVFDLAQAMLLYALDGIGSPIVKADLTNGETRTMDLFAEDSLPEYTRIGDKQYHHFTLTVPTEAKSLSIELDGEDGYDFKLYANPGDFAFENESLITSIDEGSDHTMAISLTETGTWYIGVECATTISSAGVIYWGQTEVLNGIAYTITATWDTVAVVGVADLPSTPSNFELYGNYPNPFNPSTNVRYSLTEYSNVRVTIFDVSGRPINHLRDEEQEAGTYNIRWNGTESQGLGVPTGVYFARLEAGLFSQTIKMLYLK